MHAHLTPVSTTRDSADSTCPIRPNLQPPQTPTAVSSPAAAFSPAGHSPFSTSPDVDTSVFDIVPDRRGTASLKWDFAADYEIGRASCRERV